MYQQKKYDCHVHSDCSPKGEDSVMSLCEQAINRGLYGFAITDCCDCDRFDEQHFGLRIKESVYCSYKARSVFSDSLVITNGIEVSQPLENIEKANKIINSHQFDIVLVSEKKYLNGQKLSDIAYGELSENEITHYLEFYYQTLYDIVKWGNFDVLSQIAFPLRYIDLKALPYFSLRSCDDVIEAVLKLMAENGKALEVNTSALRRNLNMVLPPVRYIRMFKELGGEFITVGSGAHNTSSLGSDLSEGISLIAEAGFDSYYYYEKRKPVQIKINY